MPKSRAATSSVPDLLCTRSNANAQECERTQFSDGHVFLLGATSNPDQVDPEVLDCFQERMAVTLPNRDARIKLFTRLLTDKKIDFTLDDGALLLAELTEGKSFDSRDIENSVQAAQQKALLRALRNGGGRSITRSHWMTSNLCNRLDQSPETKAFCDKGLKLGRKLAKIC
jgi:SpoVK/Ycf46/Vps4 family AAA+-type ATPase